MSDKPQRPGTMSDAARATIGRVHRGRPVHDVPTLVDDDITGQYQGEDLARARARRPTEERIARVETKQDEDRKAIHTIALGLEGIRGELKILPELVDLIKGQHATEHETKRQGMAGRTKVIIAILGVITTGLAILGGASLGGCA